MKDPIISIVMPAYNAEQYIEKSINSVLIQSFSEWELIVIDDCSTDSTLRLVEQYEDPRIRRIRRNRNSGSAYVPREDGIKIAKGEWIINLDSDDYISQTYLEKLYKEAKLKNVDICTAQMVVVDNKEKETGYRVPNNNYEFNVVKSNKEAFNLTVPYWIIGMNGALIRRSVWEKALQCYKKEGFREIHDDENLSRLLLLHSNGFISIKEEYYIRTNPTSVTNTFSLKTFGWMRSNLELKDIARSYYGNDSNELFNTEYYDFLSYKITVNEFIRKADKDTVIDGITLLKKWHQNIDWQHVLPQCKNRRQELFKYFQLSLILCMIRHPRPLFCKYQVSTFLKKMSNLIRTNKYYCWYITRKQRERKIRKRLEAYYISRSTDSKETFVACIYDGAIQAGGLADRLKGIIGVYYLAKNNNIPFKLYFMNPFPLEDYFTPNSYDWRVSKEELTLNPNEVSIVILDNTQDSSFQIEKQKIYLSKCIANIKKQTHIYTNSSFAYELDYAVLFNELFKPSNRLQKAITNERKMIGSKYISVSCRFLDLLGDFNETYGCGKRLNDFEKRDLLERLDKAILSLHNQFPDMKILINSDSSTFLDRYMNVEYAHIIHGNITHIDAEQEGYDYKKYEKTFLDFMMIAGAEQIYLIKSDRMHKSGYPYAASKIYDKPFKLIEV